MTELLFMTCMGKKTNAYRVLVGKPEGKKDIRKPACKWWIILKWISKKQDGMAWIILIWFRMEKSGGLL